LPICWRAEKPAAPVPVCGAGPLPKPAKGGSSMLVGVS
jgi:hypothetical protein